MSFEVSFVDNEIISFTDNTDYTALTVDKTYLLITYPDITENQELTIPLYDVNISTLGDNVDLTVETTEDVDLSLLPDLIDGVYKLTFVLENIGVEVSRSTIYRINDYSVQNCLRNKLDVVIDKQCSSLNCEIGLANALLDTAIRLASEDRFSEAQEYMYRLSDICDGSC
jgi:hypothetical protein